MHLKNSESHQRKNPIAVIKVGGDMVLQDSDRLALASNINDLLKSGWRCVVLHGGGPQLNVLQQIHGLTPHKIEGRRITSLSDLKVVKQALCGEVNVDLVSALVGQGISAFGCHGASGQLIKASKRPPMDLGPKGVVDFGEVGDVVKIKTKILDTLLEAEQVPVIASLGIDDQGRVFNINADTTVAAIASALRADLLILSTKVGGIFENIDKPETRIPKVSPKIAERLIDDQIITDGMIPKVRESLGLLTKGVAKIAITNAANSGGFLKIAQGSKRIGTILVRD
ncbi:MAG: acetylglutamate kinase [Gammaproteobacteria bacterium]|nr:acetylglutamate kinase [Gammaproteobacteria bacterium]